MAIKYISGDLFENRFGAEAFGHGCNLQGSMGTALERMKRQANEEGIRTVAISRIGTAYGGLSRKKVRTIIERVFDDCSGTLYVYEKYITGQSG